ncbi:MAG: hypothetical protein Q8R79_04600 [Legionellaceae bacterium]|nr:hypothetical protein [Legionellaceae bacterium]
MNSKIFAQRFNRELAYLGFPEELFERTKAFMKVFGVNRYIANGMLFGQALPSEMQLDQIASVLEVCPQWLVGVTDKRKTYAEKEDEKV